MGGAAGIVFGSAAVIMACSVWLLVYRRAFGKVDLRVGAMHATLEGVSRKVDQIDHAVNQRPIHESTVSDDVREIRRMLAALRTAVMELHAANVARLDAIEARLKPKEHP